MDIACLLQVDASLALRDKTAALSIYIGDDRTDEDALGLGAGWLGDSSGPVFHFHSLFHEPTRSNRIGLLPPLPGCQAVHPKLCRVTKTARRLFARLVMFVER